MKRKWIIVLTPIFMGLVGVITGLTAYHKTPPPPANVPTLTAFSSTTLVLYSVMAFLLWMSLRNFTARLKIAFALFCIGAVLFAASHIQIPIGMLLGLENSPWMKSGGVLIPMILSLVAMYIGVQRAAGLFGITSRWRSGWLVTLFAIGLATASALLPPAAASNSPEEARGGVALITVCMAIFIACAMLAYRIKQSAATTVYGPALNWFFVMLAGLAVVTGLTVAAEAVLGNNHWILNYGYTMLLEIIMVPIFLKTGYEFTFIEGRASDSNTSNKTMLDIVICAAAKASNPRSIEPLMDKVRAITADLPSTEELSEKDKSTLTNVYHGIETYLAETEPVRRYSPEELRSRITRELHLSNSNWLQDS